MEEIVGNELVFEVTTAGEDGEERKQPLAEALPESVECVGLYFGAHWAPCCRRFQENLLLEKYNEMNGEGQPKKFEVVFVSKDGNQKHFNHNFKNKMAGWKAVSFSDESRKKSLEQKYGVMEIPTMIVLDR